MKMQHLVLSTLISLGAATTALAVETPKVSCTADAKSPSFGTPATQVGVVNYTPWAAKLFWINAQGEKVVYQTLQAGQSTLMKTYEGHVWMMAWADSDACVSSYISAPAPSTISFTGAWTADLGCNLEASLSRDGFGGATSITFANNSGATAKIYWVNASGQRQHMSDVAPNQSYLIRTTVGHVFVATNASGACRGVFRAYDDLWADVR